MPETPPVETSKPWKRFGSGKQGIKKKEEKKK
jgi:hypothetical protein